MKQKKSIKQYENGTKDTQSGSTEALEDEKMENLKNLCRICLSHSKIMTPLLSDSQDLLANMFTSITSIQVYQNDGLPTHVCNKCEPEVIKCYEFKLKCEKSDNVLKALVKNNHHIKKEPIKIEMENNLLIEDTELTLSEIKEETLKDDADYLESLSNSDREAETVCFFQDVSRGKKKKYDITIGDAVNLTKKIILEMKTSKKKKKLYMCPICFKNFPKAKILYAHVKEYHPPVPNKHPCAKCSESFATERDLKLHSTIHAKGSTCTQCKKDFKSNTMLRRHIQRHMETKRYSCGACSKTFTELYALRRHVRVHTGETLEKKLACHVCDKRYSDSTQLATHIARHTGDRPCVCATCGKKFASKRLLKSHQLTHSDYKPYPCSFCDRRFRHESTRNTHHRTHTGEKPYICSFCGKTFIQNSNLSLHLRTHTGERPYNCGLCDRKFSSGSSLAAHKRTHTGEKPYACPICGKRFARMGMTVHLRQHSGERPYSCHICPKEFATAARLRQHCRIHTGEKPFECVSCDQKFTAKAHLTKHIKSHRRPKNKEIVQRIDSNVPISIPSSYIITETANDDTEIHVDEDILNKSSVNEDHVLNKSSVNENNILNKSSLIENNMVVNVEEVPMEVGQELILPSDNETETNILVVDNSGNNKNSDISTNEVNYINSDQNSGEVNLVTVNEGEVNISASSAVLEGATVKLYQVDQSLVQIHSVGGQVTISKIISKMTANF